MPIPTKTALALAPFALVASLAAVACDKGAPPTPRPSASAAPLASGSAGARDDVVALVNGVAITDADLKLKLKGDMHGAENNALHRKNALEALIRQELVRQKAFALGLDSDQGYQHKLRGAEAQMAAFQRTELGEVWFRREVVAKAEVSDADARAYFEANAKRIKTELHVLQILRINDEPGIAKDLAELQKGTPFEEIVKKQFPGLPATEKPWDLGQMKWAQVPDAWREALEKLEPGQTSGILHGAKGRAWIIKLVDRRVDESVTFESIKGAVVEAMRGSRLEKIREDGERALREAAKIELVKPDAKPAGEE